MKGFVPTPRAIVDSMVNVLFADAPPNESDAVLDPGCGTGRFIDGIIQWCINHGVALPRIVGVESDPRHIDGLAEKYTKYPTVQIENRDYLDGSTTEFKYVVGNPPYVPITQLSETEKARYRGKYVTARGRFDLYLLFFEQALRNLAPEGRLVFITPEKFLYVQTAEVLRDLLAQHHIESIELADEAVFGALVTYPTITSVKRASPGPTLFKERNGPVSALQLPRGGASWMPLLARSSNTTGQRTLADLCVRISCGIATGADSVYILPERELSPELAPFSRPTIAGRDLMTGRAVESHSQMLIPYDEDGRLLPETSLGALGAYLGRPTVKAKLLARTCVKHKPWYAFHETPILPGLLRPKILCKDICEQPVFVADLAGDIVPRHSVYYIVPRDTEIITALLDYFNSEASVRWLRENCQRAAKGYLRIQSRTLQRLPIPDELFNWSKPGQEVGVGSYDSEQPALHF